MPLIPKPTEQEYDPFYADYVAELAETDPWQVLLDQIQIVGKLPAAVPAERETFRYAPGKWSVRQVVGHMTDGERVFGHRAFCVARGDTTPLPGFDENTYVQASQFEEIQLAELAGEFVAVRRSNLALLAPLDPGRWARTGSANGAQVSVRALAFMIGGHARHHLRVLRERYGISSLEPA